MKKTNVAVSTSYLAALRFDKDTVRQNLKHHQVGFVDGYETHMLYSIFDTRTGEFGPPTVSRSGFVIARGLADLVKSSPSIPFASFPGDFILYCLGRFDARTGILIPYALPQPIGTIKSVIEYITPSDIMDFLSAVDALTAPQPKPETV